MINNLSNDIEKSNDLMLKRIALKAEQMAKDHLQKQDLGWEALKPSTLKQKIRKGLSEKTLIATSSYFQSITSFNDKNAAYAGVKRTARNKEGQELANIAKIQEYGSKVRNIPARPLWQPVFRAMIRYIREKQLFAKAFIDYAKKKY
jgi:hypothetical protein